jgi:hypothetical protein
MKRRLPLWTALLLISLAWAYVGSSPTSAAKAFYAAVGSGKTDDALGLMSQQTIATIGEPKLRAGIQGASQKVMAKGGLKDVEITEEQSNGDIASVKAILKYGNGTQETETLQLVKEKGGWRLQPKK